MLKIQVTNPIRQKAILEFTGEEAPRLEGPSLMVETLVIMVKSLVDHQGKPLGLNSLTAQAFVSAMNTTPPTGWSYKIVEGELSNLSHPPENLDAEFEEIEIDASEFEGDLDAVLDRATNDVSSVFEADIRAATSFEEVQSLFMDAVGVMREKLEAQGISYGVSKGQARAAREKINSQVVDLLDNQDKFIPLSISDRELLAQYSGRGGLTENNETEYYTPQPVAESKWELLKENGFSGGSVGEFSCGTGVFLGTKPKNTKMVASELSNISSQCAQLLHPDDDIQNLPFEELAARMPDSSLDAVIGNAPFSDSRPEKHKDPAYAKRNLTLEQYFVLRSIDKVRHGGLVSLILPTRVVSRESKGFAAVRREISLKAEFLGAVRLPSNTFKQGQHGTSVPVDVILLKKHPEGMAEKLNHMKLDVLKQHQIFLDDFISGQWFKRAGKRFLLGEETREGSWNRLKVSFEGTEEERQRVIRQTLGQKFKSRIDWAVLDLEPVELPQYAEGDSQLIAGRNHVLNSGKWIPQKVQVDDENLDKGLYGADSLDQLIDLLKTPATCMKLTLDNLEAIDQAYPDMIRDYPMAERARAFALDQDGPLQTIAWRGSLLGQRLTQLQIDSRQGDVSQEALELVQSAVGSEVDKYNSPQKIKGLNRRRSSVRDWLMYESAIDSQTGAFSDLLQGEYDATATRNYDSGSITSIISYLTGQTTRLDVAPEDALELYKGVPVISDVYGLIRDEGVALTDLGRVMLIEHYMSGDIYLKLSKLDRQIEREDNMRFKSKYVWQREYILKNRTFTTLDQVDARFSDKWLDRKYIEEFLEFSGFDFFYDEDTGFWDHEGAAPKLFDAQLLKYINRGFALKNGEYVKVKGGGKVRGADAEANEEYRALLADLEAQFNDFLRNHEESEFIAEQYNSIFNTHMPVTYSSDPLGLQNFSGDAVPHGFQNRTVRRMSDDGKGIIGFDVGLGKTFTALALVQFNIENGRSKRSAITVPKAVLSNWYHEARTLYKSMDHMLFIGLTPEKDKQGNILKSPVLDSDGQQVVKGGRPVMQDKLIEDSVDEIRRKMWLVPQTNKKVVVMSVPQFSRIPLKPDTMQTYTGEMVENEMLSDGTATEYLMSAVGYTESERKQRRKENQKILAAKDEERSDAKFAYKQAQKTNKWQEKYSDDGTVKRQDYPFYEDMGFDSVVVDEAHYFKNVYEVREERGLKYLASTEASQRGTDMAIKMNFMKKNNEGRGPYMLTATPLTNSPIEAYNALSLVTDMSEFERMGIKTPDDFIRVFAETGTVEVQKLSGEIATAEGIVGFKNLKALRNLFNRFADVKTKDDVDFDSGISPPNAKEQHTTVDLSDEQQEGYEFLRDELAESISSSGIDRLDAEGNVLPPARPLFSIMRDMERLTTDVDLYYKQMTWRFPAEMSSQVEVLISTGIPKSVTGKRYDPEEEKQVTIKVSRPEKIELIRSGELIQFRLPVEFEDAVLKRLNQKSFDKLKAKVSHPISGKYAELISNVNKHIKSAGKQIVFTDEKKEHGKLLRILLANTTLEASEISIINADTAGDPEVLQGISDDYNSGRVKLVIANEKAEVGVNLQKGTSAIHHLTLPWTPASIQQRNGRGVRQGNELEFVDVYYYVAKGSLDINRLDTLKAKANWINQIMNSDDSRLENPDAAAEASADIIKSILGEQAYEEKMAAERLIKERKRKVRADKTALNSLGAMSRISREKKGAAYQIEKAFEAASVEFGELEYSYTSGKKVPTAYSWHSIESKLAAMSDSDPDKAGLQVLYEKAIEDKEVSAQKYDKKLSRIKGQLSSNETLPFDRKLLDSPENTFTPKGTSMVIYEGSYIDIIPLSTKKESTSKTGVYQVRRIDFASEIVHLENVYGDPNAATELKGNSRNGENDVPFSKWPSGWKPISMTPDLEHEFEIKKHEGTLDSFLERWDKDDILAYADPSKITGGGIGFYGARMTTHLLINTGEGYSLKYVSGKYNFTNLDRLVFPDQSNESLKSTVIELAKDAYGFQSDKDQIHKGLNALLRLYVGGDYTKAYRDSFKSKNTGEALVEFSRDIISMVNSAPNDVLGNPISLWTWLDEPDSKITNLMDSKLGEYTAEGYENIKQIEAELRKMVVTEKAKFTGEARKERERLNEIEAEKSKKEAEIKAAKEAEIASEKTVENQAIEVEESKEFTAQGGMQLSVDQVAEFKRLGFDVQIITKEWGYPKPKKGRAVSFPAGKYLKVEGPSLRTVFRKDNNTDVNQRFSGTHADKSLYKWPRIMTTFRGREGDEICLTPISNIDSDVTYYLELLKS